MKKKGMFLFLIGVFFISLSFISAWGPLYADVSTNNTIVGKITLFSINITNELALEPDGQYIFSTNNTGNWINDSGINFTSTPSWANVTKILNSTSRTIVGYVWFFNDSLGNANSTLIYTLNTTEADIISPQVNITAPTSGKVFTKSSVSFGLITNENSTCSYSLNSGATNYSMDANLTGTGHTISKSLSNGNYTVNYYCSDTSGNRNNTKNVSFSVNDPEEEDEDSNDEEEEETALTFKPTYRQIQNGYEGFFKETDLIRLNLSIRGIYTLEIKDVNRYSENITFSINLTNYSLSNKNILKLNLNNDSYYDLEISVISITPTNNTRMIFKEIYEEIPIATKEEINEESNIDVKKDKSPLSKNKIIGSILFGIVGLVIIGFAIWKVHRYLRYKNFGY